MGLARFSGRCAALAALAVVTALAVPVGGAATAAAATATASVGAGGGTAGAGAGGAVVVRGVPGGSAAVERAVAAVGGTVTRRLPIIDGVAASVPEGAVDRLRQVPAVAAVTPDATGRVMAVDPRLGFDPATDTGSLGLIERIVGADRLWAKGYTGRGVDVAVIDTGVSPVPGLTSGNVINGPDLSFDGQRSDLRYKDWYGHGTHMAGIIAGRDVAGLPSSYTTSNARFTGIAPDARIVNVKVGASDGAADVSQVIAAINWVTENRNRDGLNIRVLNLSYGTDSTQDYRLDPLSYAAEVAWRKGIVVVVAAGNDGTTKQDLANPALNPNLLAVGASDPMGTAATGDDTLPDFSNRGTTRRYVDVVAPGTSVLGPRVPGGAIDTRFPASRVGTRFTRGSGTSQATAVASGAAALLLSVFPGLTPGQVKGALTRTAVISPAGTPKKMGAGIVNVWLAATTIAQDITGATNGTKEGAKPGPAPEFGTGTGSLQLARGSVHLADNGIVLSGEQDIFGRSWRPATWAPAALAGTTWYAGTWNGSAWTGMTWATPGDWNGRAWVGTSWSGTSWSGRAWVGNAWAGRRWVTDTWASGYWR